MEYLLDDSWKDITTFIPYGYGRVGKRVLPKLSGMFQIPFVIDNNPIYKNQDNTVEIINLNDGIRRRTTEKIVVLTVETAYVDIKRSLEDEGLIEYKDFCILERFLGEWFLKYQKKCVLSKVDTVLTFRCSLNCKHCAMFIGYGARKEHSFDEIKNNVDLFFDIVDYVLEFTLLGGEPMIHKQLNKVIEYLGSKYADKIGQIVLITNGNVVLDDTLISVLKEYGVILSISDYTEVHDYHTRLNSLIELLENNEIPFYFNKEMEWKDHGYPTNPRNYSDSEAAKHMKLCGHTAHSMNEGRLYYCDPMYGAEVNTGFKTDKNDVLDFKVLKEKGSILEAKERVISYCFGQINEKGFPSFCKVCGGIGHDNPDVIRAGE